MERSYFKECSRCGVQKETKEFSAKSRSKDGLQSHCKSCGMEICYTWRKKKMEGKGQAVRPYRSRYEGQPRTVDEFGNIFEFNQATTAKLRQLLTSAKVRAKEKGCPLDIDIQYVASLYVDKCPLLGIDLSWGNSGMAIANSPSLDKIDPRLGYVHGNVWIISHRANTIKSDATPQELLAIANALLAR